MISVPGYVGVHRLRTEFTNISTNVHASAPSLLILALMCTPPRLIEVRYTLLQYVRLQSVRLQSVRLQSVRLQSVRLRRPDVLPWSVEI